jgi:hypothetical protein
LGRITGLNASNCTNQLFTKLVEHLIKKSNLYSIEKDLLETLGQELQKFIDINLIGHAELVARFKKERNLKMMASEIM